MGQADQRVTCDICLALEGQLNVEVFGWVGVLSDDGDAVFVLVVRIVGLIGPLGVLGLADLSRESLTLVLIDDEAYGVLPIRTVARTRPDAAYVEDDAGSDGLL